MIEKLKAGVALWGLIAFGFFMAGCEKPNDGKVHLTLAVATGMAERADFERVVRLFMKEHPGVSVQILELPGNYYQKLLVMIAGNSAPDLMWMGEGFGEFARRGVFLDVTDRIQREVDLPAFNPAAIGWYRLNGRQYAIPFGLDLKFIVYNKKIFDAVHVPYPTNDWTYEQFLDVAQRLSHDTNGDGIIDQYGFRGELDASLFKARFISSDGLRATCNTPEMIKYLRTNCDLADKYHVAASGKQVRSESMDDLVSLFQQRAAPMMQMATWNLPYLHERCEDMDWDIVVNPEIDQRTHWASSQAMVISVETKHPDEAWALSKMFISDEFERAVAKRLVPTNMRIAEEVLGHSDEKPFNTRALLIASRSMVPNPRVPNLRELFSLWTGACESVWSGRATPEQAMDRADKDINRTIRVQQKLYK